MCTFGQKQNIVSTPVQGLEPVFLDAALKGDLSKVKDLLEHGCPVNAQNKVSTTVESFHIIRQIYIYIA